MVCSVAVLCEKKAKHRMEFIDLSETVVVKNK